MKHQNKQTVQLESIPSALKERNQWVAWRYEQRKGKQTKIPYRVDSLTSASTSDSSTWGSYTSAVHCLESKHVDGIGYVFTSGDPYVGVDLDNSLEPETHTAKQWASSIIAGLDSYTEISPSRQGVKVILEANKNDKRCRTSIEDGQIEIYDTGRFFTITGDVLSPKYATIESRHDQLDSIYHQVFPAVTAPVTSCSSGFVIHDDKRLLRKMFASTNGKKIDQLYHGDWSDYASQSEADLALATHLAFWTGKDQIRMDSFFRASKLYRDKWDDVHDGGGRTYGQMTIDKACCGVSSTYDLWFSSSSTVDAAEATHQEQRLFPKEVQFPVDALPPVMSDIVTEIAEKRNVHPALVATTALCVVASSVQNVADVQTRGWSPHPLSIWAILIASSGEGKSRGMRDVLKPFHEIEHKKANEARQKQKENKSVVTALRREANERAKKCQDGLSLLEQLNKSDVSSCGTMPIHALRETERKIFELENPQPRSCLFNDHTPEHMLQEIEFTGERASAIVNESRFLDNALGLTYQKGSGITNLIQMWDGDTIEYGRKADGLAKVYQHPVLTMCVCMTPEKFEGKYRRIPSFVDEGFGQRFLFVQASVPLKGKSDTQPDPDILNAWNDTIHELATLEIPKSEDDKPQPHVIHFDDEAEELLDHLSKQLADKLTGCRERLLPFWASWNTRILANIIRIAGLLHAVRHESIFTDRDICFSDTEVATSIMKFYCSQAESVINGTSVNEIERVQGIIREYLDSQKRGFRFTLRSLNQNLTKSITGDKNQRRADKIRTAFEALTEDGYPVVELRDGKQQSFERT